MILIDANLLIYGVHRESPHHAAANAWLRARLEGHERVGLPWPTLLGFLRVMTHPRVMPRPMPLATAWAQVEEWLGLDPVWVPAPTAEHGRVLGPLLAAAGRGGNAVPDAHLAALAIEHGLTLCSRDTDFARFPGLRWVDPLQAAAPPG